MHMEKRKKELYIPINSPDTEDFISGIGKVELTIIMIVTFLSIAVGVIYSIITTNTLGAVALVVTITMSTIVIVRRDQYNENLIRKFEIVIEFIKSQKKFNYKYVNIYESYEGIDYDEDEE